MEWPCFSYSHACLLPTALLLLLAILLPQIASRRRLHHLPPGPRGLPLFGNLFDLGAAPHEELARMKVHYGDVLWLKLGAVGTLVIQSASSAAEFFKRHDADFAERTITDVMRAHDYHKGSVALAGYGPVWRVLRRLITMEMVVTRRINDTVGIRRKCLDDMLRWIEEEAESITRLDDHDGRRVGLQVSKFVFLMSFNMLGNLMLSRDLLDPKSGTGSEFFTAMNSLMQWSGRANVSDFFPILRWFDIQGLRRNMVRDLGRALEIASSFVEERVREKRKGGDREGRDFLDLLLEYEGTRSDEPAKIGDKEINIFILEIFMAGSETTSSTTEWAMTELLHNPTKLAKLKSEMRQVVGDRVLEESDIEALPYLQAVVNETLRLHPPIPFLVPRRAMRDTKFLNYDIPENTQVFVNTWAIGRDPEIWTDPDTFDPERFIGSRVEYRGKNFEFIPFGAGRRMCAGVPLAHRILNLVLGSLVHSFDWELESLVRPEAMDARGTLGITMRKLEPLRAVPTKRRGSH
uniref:Cytochrome P450 n=1 Tax=Kalanchoe fedtschenkoi TaxID=63787 RepID=A0A7N0SYN8_KALFE